MEHNLTSHRMLRVGEFRGHREDKMLDTTAQFHLQKYFIDMSIYYTFLSPFGFRRKRGNKLESERKGEAMF